MSLAEWRGAWAARGDNPLISYGLLSRRRRWLSVPWYRRNFAILLVGLGLTAALVYTWLTYQSAQPDPLWLQLLAIMMGVGWMFLSLWLMHGVFQATTAALSFQGPERQRGGNLRLDDMVALTRLSSAELALGAIMPLVRPLLERVIVLAAFSAASLVALMFADSYISGSANVLDWVRLLSQPMNLELGRAIFASAHPLLYTLFIAALRSRSGAAPGDAQRRGAGCAAGRSWTRYQHARRNAGRAWLCCFAICT